MGGPKLTVTGYGNRRGHFQTKRRFSKLKMLPHTPSSATGTMGASTSCMIFSIPRRKGNNCPIRVI